MADAASDKKQYDAYTALVPALKVIDAFYDFCGEVGAAAPRALDSLLALPDVSHESELAKLLAHLFELACRLDGVKMMNPHIQNAFSYYRRNITRIRELRERKFNIGAEVVPEQKTNMVSMLLALPRPVMASITNAAADLARKPGGGDGLSQGVLATIAQLAHGCCLSAGQGRARAPVDARAVLLALRAMTGALIVYDHVDPEGAFVRGSLLKAKRCVSELSAAAAVPALGEGCRELLSGVEYSTRTFATRAPEDVKVRCRLAPR